MASIGVGGGHGDKKALDADIPLVPFIDLLLCCVMFLLVTAVWNQLAAVQVSQDVPSTRADRASSDPIALYLQVSRDGYALASSAGDRVEIPRVGGAYDRQALRARLHEWQLVEPTRHQIIVAPEDGVAYEDVIAGMDLAMGAGFDQVSLSDGTAL